jgi:hypothetical protein
MIPRDRYLTKRGCNYCVGISLKTSGTFGRTTSKILLTLYKLPDREENRLTYADIKSRCELKSIRMINFDRILVWLSVNLGEQKDYCEVLTEDIAHEIADITNNITRTNGRH